MLRGSLESACVYPFLQRNFEGRQHLLSTFANLSRRAIFLGDQLSSSVTYVVVDRKAELNNYIQELS